MKRLQDLPAWPFVSALVIVLIAYLMMGCSHPPARGSAQDDAVAKQERARTERQAADVDAILAAELGARAALDEATAVVTRLPADIERAAQSKAAAIVAKAIADAEEATATKAERAAVFAQDAAQTERKEEAKSADARAFAFWTRWVGLGGVLIGAVIGLALARLMGVQTGLWIGGGVAGLGFLATAFGATVTWLPVALMAGIVVALGLWASFHGREKQATAAVKDVAVRLSHTLDTVEGSTSDSIAHAKQSLTAAINRSGLSSFFAGLRNGWNTTTVTLPPIADEFEPSHQIESITIDEPAPVEPAPVVVAEPEPVPVEPAQAETQMIVMPEPAPEPAPVHVDQFASNFRTDQRSSP